MKISKLFHWLYAVLMFLPLLVFLPTGLYYAFNDNAQAQEYTREEPVYYQTNEVNEFDDLIPGNYYTFTKNNFVASNTLQILFFEDYSIIQGTLEYNGVFGSYGNVPYIRTGGGTYENVLLATSNDDATHDVYYLLNSGIIIDFLYTSSSNLSTFLDCISSCPRPYVKEYREVTYTMSIADSMANAWEHTWEIPLFSWSEQTFLNQPFNYITGLFSIPNGSTFSNAFGYWLSISICWLVFDVIMYVPMLVHRWIDKARLE